MKKQVYGYNNNNKKTQKIAPINGFEPPTSLYKAST